MIENYKEIKEILDLSISVDGDTEITFIDNEGNGKKNYWICDYDLLEYIKQLQQRIDKTIEYIENHIVATETEEILLSILKGEDK